jgi:phosphomevalonate kinase
MPSVIRVSAPGKVMISGEYVVLDGAPAVVAAAGARAIVELRSRASGGGRDRSPGSPSRSLDPASLPPEAVVARRCAERELGALDTTMTIDTRELRGEDGPEGPRKLGLGSSAAAAAGAVAAIAAAHGRDISRPEIRAELLPIALEGHAAVAPEGSGADVAASMLGGFVRFRRDRERVLEAASIAWPEALRLALIWTGKPARTSDLVRSVKALEARDPSTYRRAIAPLHEAAGALLAAIERADVAAAIEAAGAHGDAMQLLGEAAGAPIVTEELAKAAAIARAVGGAAKPSGAGGGDVAIAFVGSARSLRDLEDACRGSDLTLLSLHLGDDGPRREA